MMDLFECSVCFNDMLERSPRIVPCLHSFCTECLQQLINNNKINCPTCREVTELKSNDVKELKVNFNLHQMKEQMEGQKEKEQEKPLPGTKTKSLCQICHQTEAIFKCKDCPHLLCEPCKKNHSDIEDFKSHSVFDLCQVHDEGITHLCKQCVKPLCTRCMLLDHTEHKKHFVKYEKGIEELQNDAKITKGNIEAYLSAAYKNHEEIKLKYEWMTEMKGVCQDLKKQLRDKMKEVDEIFKKKVAELELVHNEEKKHLEDKIRDVDDDIRESENKKKVYEDMRVLYDKERNECTVVAASLNSLINSKAGFCNKYKKVTQKANQCLIDMKKHMNLEYKVPQFLLATVHPVNDVMNLKVTKTLLTVDQSNEINGKWDITFIGPDVIMVTDNKPCHVIRFNMKGHIVARYYPEHTDNQINNLFVYDNNIYILQHGTITIIPQNHKKC